MLEGTPKYPLEGLVSHLTRVERNMRLRRKRLMEALADDEIAPTVRVKAPGADGPEKGRAGKRLVLFAFIFNVSYFSPSH